MLGALALLMGCFVSRGDNPAYTGCESADDCETGACVAGFCVADPDGGVADAALDDAGTDMGDISCGEAFPTGCGEDTECCGEGDARDCVMLDTNPLHCGGCGIECGEGEACCMGMCRDADAAECMCPAGCGPDETCCNGTCTDTRTDRNACGDSCMACEEGAICCDGSCVPVNAENCGSCGVVCEGDGVTCCGDRGCQVLGTPTACSGCGNVCANGATCVGGACCGGEDSAFRDCDGECVDTDNDVKNCGACGNDCATLLGLPLVACNSGNCGRG
ncbi:MAG: hypothetical protein CMN30_23345 [Sandaracinus sp.]|nr:hypothetical protein [Sandaracinus sp.]